MAEPGYVYILGTVDRTNPKTYVGWTLDLERRLKEHNSGIGAKSTRGQKWQLLYAEKLENRQQAMSREWYLKKDRKFRSRFLP
jgi:putative endonuclease